MIRAVLRNGVFYPLEPIPADWVPGDQLRVEQIEATAPVIPAEIDQWSRQVDQAVQLLNDMEEWAAIERNLEAADACAKDQMRREMGLG